MSASPVESRRAPKNLRLAGTALVALALFGFATVADELHHWEEWLAVAAVFLAGLVLLTASSFPAIERRFPFRGLALGLALGGIAGLLSNQVPIVLPLGIVLGLAFGYRRLLLARARA